MVLCSVLSNLTYGYVGKSLFLQFKIESEVKCYVKFTLTKFCCELVF